MPKETSLPKMLTDVSGRSNEFWLATVISPVMISSAWAKKSISTSSRSPGSSTVPFHLSEVMTGAELAAGALRRDVSALGAGVASLTFAPLSNQARVNGTL